VRLGRRYGNAEAEAAAPADKSDRVVLVMSVVKIAGNSSTTR
jgi:hypothetical protein